jgi:hypothetical protein
MDKSWTVRALILESDDIAPANRHAVSGIIIGDSWPPRRSGHDSPFETIEAVLDASIARPHPAAERKSFQ